MKWLRPFTLGAVLLGMTAPFCGAAALPFPEGSLLPNQQTRPASVAVDGNYAAVIMPGGIPRTFEKSGGNWIDILGDLPASALSIAIRGDATPMAAIGYSGRIELLTYDSSNAQWDALATITLASGAQPKRLVFATSGRLAALVGGGFDDATDVRVFEGSGASWSQTKVLTIPPPPDEIIAPSSVVEGFDLSGTRIAIGSGTRNEVRIHERDSGGTNNWGLVRTILPAAGHTSFGNSLALEIDRLVVNSIDGTDGKPDIRAYQKDTGGANQWGFVGTALDGATTFQVANFAFDLADGQLIALGLPSAANLIQGNSGGQGWFFSTGAGPGGWVQEAKYDFGRISPFGQATQLIALDNGECFIGLTDEEYLDSHGAAWATCVHRRGAGTWNLAQLLEGEGAPQAMGKVIAMDGAYLIAGMPDDDGRATDSGAAMLWRVIPMSTNGDRWFPIARIESPSPVINERFGEAVAIHTDEANRCWIAIGAPGRLNNTGAVYLYHFSSINSPPTVLTKTPAAALTIGDKYGSSVALSGNNDSTSTVLAVGAPGRSANAGAAWLFRQDLGGTDAWGEWKNITRPVSPGGTGFGTRIALSGMSRLAVSQPPAGGAPGIVHAFDRDQGGSGMWGLITTLTAPAGASNRFAEALSANSLGILIGAPGGTAGRAYYYFGSPSPTLYTTFAPSSATANFGSAVAMGDGMLAIGDPSPSGASESHVHAWAVTSFAPLTWSEHFQQSGGFSSAFGTAVGSSYFYVAGGAPLRSDAGSEYGAIDVYRAGPYEIWAAAQGSGFNNWYPDEDADRDGQKNLVEFALGSNPRNGGSVGALTMNRTTYVNGSTSWPAVRFVRPTLPYSTNGMHYRMNRTTDLVSWRNASYSTLSGDAGARYYRSDEAKAFHRLAPKYPEFTTEDEGIILAP